MRKLHVAPIAALLLLLLGTIPAHGTTVSYTAVDLPNVQPGVDLWQYQYTVSNFTFGIGQGFSIYFNESLYADLANPVASAEWDPLVLQPDPVLGAGLYDALAKVDAASLATPFTVDYVWLGMGTPGVQPFDVYALDASGGLTILETGQTTAAATPVPEPATLLLLGSGIAAVLTFGRRMRSP